MESLIFIVRLMIDIIFLISYTVHGLSLCVCVFFFFLVSSTNFFFKISPKILRYLGKLF